MKDKITFGLLFLVGFLLGLLLMANDARAQQPGPGTEKSQPGATGEARAQQPAHDADKGAGPYTVTSSIEFGVRGIVIDGNANKYRSDLNYTPGFRVFDSSMLVEAKDGSGLLFDKLLLNSFGWGNDPNRSLRVNAEKIKAYRFDANYRRFNYFNNLSNIALNQHTSNTEYRQGDFDLQILPANERIRFNLGYSLDRNSGPSVTTYDYQRDEFPILAPARVASDEYRFGADGRVWIFDLSFMQGFRSFKEDTSYLINAPQVGNNPLNTSAIDTFRRDLPTRGRLPFTRFSLHTLIGKRLDFTGRYIYTSATTDYSMVEAITGKDASGNNITLDRFNIAGTVKRPNGMGDIGVTLFVTDRFRISNTFGVNNFRINGGQELTEALLRTRTTPFGTTTLPPLLVDTFSFRTTKYRRAVNTFEVDYDFSNRLSAHAGHRYTDRRIELNGLDFARNQIVPEEEPETFDNRTNTYIFGFKARPVKVWSVYFDLERGSADNVFTRVANYDFTNFRVRSILRPGKTFTLNASVVTKDNTNPSPLNELSTRNFGVDVNSRVYSASVDWAPDPRFSINSGYTHAHLTSEAEIIFFSNGIRTNGLSRYFMKDNFAFFTAFMEFNPRVKLYAGYRIHVDRGQGDRLSTLSTPDLLIGSFPYQSQSPEARLSVRLHDRVDWIAGYQYFDYKERFVNSQFYQAHLPYTSLKIYFGRREQ